MKKIALVVTAAFGMLHAGAHRNAGSMNSRLIPAGDPPAKRVIADYIRAIGGEGELKKIKTIRMVVEQDLDGPMATLHRKGKPDTIVHVSMGKLFIETKEMAPNKFLTTYHTDSSRIKFHSRTVFDGTDGFTLRNGARIPLPAERLARLKRKTDLITQLQYLSDPTIKLENKGMETINGQDCYKIQVDFPDGGGSRTEYYAVKSKLLVRMVDASVTPTSTVDYFEYKMAAHVLICYRWVESQGDGNHPTEKKMVDAQVNTGVSGDDFKLSGGSL